MAQSNEEIRAAPSDAVHRLAALIDELSAHESALPARLDTAPDCLLRLLGLELDGSSHPLDELERALASLLRATPSSASPGFLNQLFGGRDRAACLAEMLSVLPNTSMYTFKVGGPQIHVEHQVLARVLATAGFAEGEGAFCPGGSLSNLTAMAIARNELLEGVRGEGLHGRRPVVYSSAEGHYSIRKNAGLLGMGRNAVRLINTDERGRMNPHALAAQIAADLEAGLEPVLVVATAGTTVMGAYDPIPALAELARQHGLWLHVDGAFGGSAMFSPRHRHLLDGLEEADSMTWDAHKMMGVPLTCSMVLLRRRGLLQKNLSEQADYLFQADADELNPGTRSLQCGRRNDALKLWASWVHQGDRGFADRVDHLFALARHAAELIRRDHELELLVEPQSVNVCFIVRGRDSAAICEALDRDGRMKIGHGEVHGTTAIRLVCVNPALEPSDVAHILEEIKAAGR